jgi:hypothetical protein
MNSGGLFKHLFWLAPTLGIIFWYVMQEQHTQKAEMKLDSATFDKEFANLNANMPGQDKKFWKEQQSSAEKKEKLAEEKEANESKKSVDNFEELEKGLKAAQAEEAKKERNK